MRRELRIHHTHQGQHIALLENERVVEYRYSDKEDLNVWQHIYKGKVRRILPGLQAVFVDIGLDQHGFLPVDDVRPIQNEGHQEYFPAHASLEPDQADELNKSEAKIEGKIEERLQVGDEVIVQVVKEAAQGKGAKLSMDIQLPGAYLVYRPYGEEVKISRRIDSVEEREHLQHHFTQKLTEKEGVIVRTAASGKNDEWLHEELTRLRRKWTDLLHTAQMLESPAKLDSEQGEVFHLLRHYGYEPGLASREDNAGASLIRHKTAYKLGEDHAEEQKEEREAGSEPSLICRVDHTEEARRLQQFVTKHHLSVLIKDEDPDRQSSFFKNRVYKQLQQAFYKKVWLKSGAFIVLESLHTLTVIDVNTGRFSGGENVRETIWQTNKEAAREAVRQIRLRDIGGIILIDFIDMQSEEERENLLQHLNEWFVADSTPVHVLGFTSLGLVEMTRHKARRSWVERFSVRV